MIKYFGLDYGAKRIGLSIGDSETRTAVVFDTVNNIKEAARAVCDENIDVVVVGKPYSVVDNKHELPADFREFVEILRSSLPSEVEVVFEDERLSSKYADSLTGGKKVKAGRDEIAAVSILQGYLDRNNKNQITSKS